MAENSIQESPESYAEASVVATSQNYDKCLLQRDISSGQITTRTLSEDEVLKLQKDTILVSEFKQMKFEMETQKNWDKFYKRNTTKFFKDRHWTRREFQELCSGTVLTSGQRVLLEVGCGVGNFIFPLLEEEDNLYIYACDFSPRAVQFVQDSPSYDSKRCCAFQCDVTDDPLTNHIPGDSVDMVTLIFVLSAIHPNKMQEALQNIVQVLKPGGLLLFRDYGLHDYAMLRFSPGHKLAESFYVRQDGTRAYYFTLEFLESIMHKAGLETLTNEYVHRDTVNKKEGLCVPRVFVQAKFKKKCEENK